MQVRIKDLVRTGYISAAGSGAADGLILAGTIGTVVMLWESENRGRIRVVFPGFRDHVAQEVVWEGTPDQVTVV